MDTPPPPRRRRPGPPPPRRRRSLPTARTVHRTRRRLAVLLAPVLLALLSVVALRLAYIDRALPGTQLGATDVAGDVRSALRERMMRFAARPLTIFAAGQQLRVTPGAAGYRIDAEATIDRVLKAGRQGPLGGLIASATGLFAARNVEPVDAIDTVALGNTTKAFTRRVNRSPYPGGLSVDPVTLQVTPRDPRAGRIVDRAVLQGRLIAALRAGAPRVRAPLKRTEVASPGAVRAVGRAAERFLAQPLTLTGAGNPMLVSAERVAPILRLRASRQDRTKVRLGSDEPALTKLIAQVAAERDQPARSARLSAPARGAILDAKEAASWRPRAAQVTVSGEARAGRTIRRAAALSAIATAIRQGAHTVALPVATAPPKISADAARRIDSLIGTFTTHYVPGQPRVTNIRRMARTVDGTLIAPGGQFSLNTVVGPRTAQGGYVKAPFIADGKLVPSIGGGVSQFSTTTYNAAYFAGLKLDTHQPHSFFIPRYPAGREATLNYPDIDLKWTNDTQTPILVRTFSDESSVTVSLYGNNGDRRVKARPGPRVPIPGGDFRITVVRTVRYADGRSVDDAFTTTYATSTE